LVLNGHITQFPSSIKYPGLHIQLLGPVVDDAPGLHKTFGGNSHIYHC